MKKMPSSVDEDEMRPEYDFDYSKGRPNPYATSFPTADSVNEALRAVIKAVPRPHAAPRKRRDKNEMLQSKRKRPARG